MISSAAVVACTSSAPTPSPSPSASPTPTPPPPPTPTPVSGPAWFGYGRDAQHTAVSAIASQDLGRIAWQTKVDLAPQYTQSGSLLTHYGSPVVTTSNTVVVPVKTSTAGNYRLEGRNGANGALIWTANSDYVTPPHNWIPPYNLLLTQAGGLCAPGSGGRLLRRASADAATGTLDPVVFYGSATYSANAATYDSTVFINTPLTADAAGNIFFGFHVTGANPASLVSGIARIGANGVSSWVGAADAASDGAIQKPAMNCAPALSNDGKTLYIAVNIATGTGSTQRGYLLALDSTTLATKAKVALIDPKSGAAARISDDGTATPVVAPDGRVFYGVLEGQFPTHNARGWLLQFDALLNAVGAPGSFGWDVSPSVIPASMVPSYNGSSTYLLAQKYNNYNGAGTGDGLNRVAVLDPKASQADPVGSGVQVMKEVMTQLGPTLDDGSATARREWCINTMAADPDTKSILANNEDGILYRWDLASNTLSQSIQLTSGIGQAYTPTLIGADGAVYAISNATLYAINA